MRVGATFIFGAARGGADRCGWFLLPLLLVTLNACGGGASSAGAGGASPAVAAAPGGQDGSAWQRVIQPFPVIDSLDVTYQFPFLGGLDVPRPQLIDIDADGDPDLFVQERSNEIMFFENVGSTSEPRFEWRTDKYQELDVHEWYRFADIDGDGDHDLLAERPFSHLAYFRNDGRPGAPQFVLAEDTLRTVDGEPLFSDRQNIPNATDLDCDGRTDLFLGRLTGTVARYEAVEPSAPVPTFQLVAERFGEIEIVNTLMGSLHGANTMDFADHDGDGDLDLFWGDFFEPGLLLLENTGSSCRNPQIRNTPVPFPPENPLQTTGYNAPTVADLNGDDLPDMLIGVLGGAYNPTRSSHENLYYLEHRPQGWELRTRRFLHGIDIGSETIPAWVDDDGDGDLDLLVGGKIEPELAETAFVYRFENTGTSTSPRLRAAGVLPMRGAYHYAPEAGDLSGDGVPDLLVGTWNDGVLYYRNTGGGAEGWVLEAEPLVDLTRGSNTTPALGDIDGDGDLDLFVGEASGTINFYRNGGGAGAPNFELVSDQWQDVDVGRRSHPALVDLDGDGDLDMVIGNEDGDLQLMVNQGAGSSPQFVAAPDDLPSFPYAAPAFADIDGDGVLELMLGTLSGGLAFYHQ